MLRSILVPLDGSDFAEHALPIAASLARQAGATLRLARVHVPITAEAAMGVVIPDPYGLRERQEEQAYLDGVARRLREKVSPTPLTLETALLEGDVVAALTDHARAGSVDLVVMATHARGAFARFWLGSVADDLVSELTAPVLLIRPGEGKPDLTREADLKTIVVPLDGSELAERAAWRAAEMARLFDADLALVRVNRPGLTSAYLPEGISGDAVNVAVDEARQIEQEEGEEARRYLEEVAAMLAVRGVRCRTDVLVQARPAEGILTEARECHAGMIAIETHARRGLARLFLGSVAEEVMRRAEVPVLMHHGE